MLWTGHTAPSAICPKHDLLWTEHTQSASVSTVYLNFRYGERWGCVLIYMAYFQIRWIVRKTTFVMTKLVKSCLLCLKCFVAQKGLIKSTSVLLSSWSSCYGLQCRINNVHVIWKCSEWGPCGDGPLITHSWWQQCPRIGDVATPLPAQVSYFILIPNNFLWNIIVTYFLSPDVNPITHVKCEMWTWNVEMDTKILIQSRLWYEKLLEQPLVVNDSILTLEN